MYEEKGAQISNFCHARPSCHATRRTLKSPMSFRSTIRSWCSDPRLLEQFEIENRGKNPRRRLFRSTAGSHITYFGSKWQCIKYLVSLTSLDLMWTKLIIKKLIRHRFWLKGRLVIILTGNRTCVRSINSKGSVRRIVITSHFTEEKRFSAQTILTTPAKQQ